MEARTHIVFGVALATLSPVYLNNLSMPVFAANYLGNVPQLPTSLSIAFLLGAGIGALGPDLDHSKALLAKHIPGVQTALKLEGTLEHAPIVGGKLEDLHLHHRGPLHSFLALVAVWLLSPWVGEFITRLFSAFVVLLRIPNLGLGPWVHQVVGEGWRIGLLLGWLSHELIDMLNSRPVFWFWPLRIPLKLFPGSLGIRTGSSTESLLRWGIILGLIWIYPLGGILTFFFSEWIFKTIVKMPESPF